MVNAWNSKKPVKYWRNFTPNDIPLADLNQKKIGYYEWNNNFKYWNFNLLAPIERYWTISNISKMIKIHNRLINGGINGTVIIEVHPKYRIGKYKNNIEVLNIYPENAQYSYTRQVFDIYEIEYYIKHLNDVGIVTETYLDQMINADNHCFVYSYKKGKNTFLHIKSKTNNPKSEKQRIAEILSLPGFKLSFPNFPSSFYNDKAEGTWKYLRTQPISKAVWNIAKHSKPRIEVDNDNNAFNMHFTFMNFKRYYEGQIAKIKSSNIRDGLDLAFLNAVKTKCTKTASSYNRNMSKVEQQARKGTLQDINSEEYHKPDKKEYLYIRYTGIKNKKPVTITEKRETWQIEKLREKHPEIQIFTKKELDLFLKDKESSKPVKENNYTGISRYVRRADRHKKRRHKPFNRIQEVYRDIKDVKAGRYPHALHANVKGDKFITPSSIIGSKIKSGNQLVNKDSTKYIYHNDKDKKITITKHNAKAYVKPLLLELKDKYGAYDRRYTVNSEVENWSIRFFIALKMIKDQLRHKKVMKYLTETCGHSKEFAEGFIKYLQLTRNGDPTREHIRNLPKQYSRIKVTKPHIQIDAPNPQYPLVIEHEVKDEESGGVKNIITENVYVTHTKKGGLKFFKYDAETNSHIFISSAMDIKKWAYVQEYTDKSETTKWHNLVSVTEKEVDQVVKNRFHIESRVKGTRLRDWKVPFPPEKVVKYLIKKLNLLYKLGNNEMLYAFIRNTVMEEYKNNTDIYEKLRFTLYHNYSGLSKNIATLIKANQMNDPDLVVFMEDLTHPHFN